jgi:hypothetical protein
MPWAQRSAARLASGRSPGVALRQADQDGQGDPAPQEVRHPARLHGVGGARGLLKEQRGGPAVPIAVAGEVEDAAPHPGQRLPQSVRRRRDHPDQFQRRVSLLQDAPNLLPLLRHGEGIGSRLAAGREQRVGGDEAGVILEGQDAEEEAQDHRKIFAPFAFLR